MRWLLAGSLVALTACPETPSDGTPEPLEDGMVAPDHDPGAGPAAPGGQPSNMGFDVTDGSVKISGTIDYPGEVTGRIRLDYLVQEGIAAPSLVHTAELTSMGDWSEDVPTDFGKLMIVAFIDADGDGPNSGDPAARLEIEVGSEDVTGLALVLDDNADLSGGGPPQPGVDGPPTPDGGDPAMAPDGSAAPPTEPEALGPEPDTPTPEEPPVEAPPSE
jgi:hypothetical protein